MNSTFLRPRNRPTLFAYPLTLGALLLTLFPGVASSQTQRVLPPPSVLKQMSMEALMDIEVTSVSKRPEKLFEAASAIKVIMGDDIRRSGATSLPEALRLASNLEVAQIDSRQWAITARGFNNVFADKMLVMIDGRSVYTPLYAGVYWDVQDTMMEDLDRNEDISGVGSRSWGANAVNGVINITTKSAKDTQGGLLVANTGTELRDGGAVRYGGKIAPDVYYRVYAKSFERDDSSRTDGSNANDAWHMAQTGFRLDWDAASSSLITFQGDFYDGTIGQAGPDNIRVSGGNLLGRWSRKFAENSEVQFQTYYDHTHRKIPGSFSQDLDTYDFDFQHRLPLGAANDFLWGLGYRRVEDDIINTPANAFLPPRVGRGWFNAFAQDEITLVPEQLHLTVGTKIEHNDYTGYELEPSARLAWIPVRNQTIWSAVSRAVRTPSRIDRDLYSPAAPPYRVAGGPNVVSEKLLSYELGYRVQMSSQFSVSLATFYNDYNDLRSLEPLNPPAAFPIEISSGLRGHSAGAELTTEWRPLQNWRIRAGYTELRVASKPQPGSNDRLSDRSFAHDPNHQVLLRSLLSLGTNWDFDTTARYVSPIGNQAVPGYTEMDLHLGWRPSESWELSLSGQNLLHSRHAEFNTPGSRRDLQRAVTSKASWRF